MTTLSIDDTFMREFQILFQILYIVLGILINVSLIEKVVMHTSLSLFSFIFKNLE